MAYVYSGKAMLPTSRRRRHKYVADVTNITLDHRKAAEWQLHHLKSWDTRGLAFLKGQCRKFGFDRAVVIHLWRLRQSMNIGSEPELVVQLNGTDSTPELGYPFGKQSCWRAIRRFSALCRTTTFSRLARCAHSRKPGCEVLRTYPIVGFDDINMRFARPALTR